MSNDQLTARDRVRRYMEQTPEQRIAGISKALAELTKPHSNDEGTE
ncbi:hypothetical protein [Nocardia xishanensis]|nr:hypothetical protein [Nocardia xishanensis]